MIADAGASMLYSIEQDGKSGNVAVTEVARPSAISTGYASLIPVQIEERTYLLGHTAGADHLDAFEFLPRRPWLKPMPRPLGIGSGKDILEAFTIGNMAHVATYEADNGIVELHSLAADLSPSQPYRFYRNHEPGVTQGFTTFKPFTCFGQVVFLGYNGTNGYVAMYALSVTATSASGIPPLQLTAVWSHQWAKGWTRFAFFQLGGENFFLKTNTWKPNVNIDHIMDNPKDGTVEVGTKLSLDNAQELDIVHPVTLDNGAPYFVTYMRKNGQITLNRFHSDCLGWTAVAALTSKTKGNQIVPINAADGKVFLLVA